jgi:hypothetical protein
MTGFCEHGNEHSSSIKTRNIFAIWATIKFSRKTPYRGVNYKNHETANGNNNAGKIQAKEIKYRQVSSDVSD